MEKGAAVQRKLSRGKSLQSSRGIFSRKTVKKSDSQSLSQTSSATAVGDDRASVLTGKGKDFDKTTSDDNAPPRPFFPARSIIPDPLNELPAWYTQAAADTPTTAVAFRSRYPMHNPVGPRWYRNWHLAPTALENRPPSFFSPSFPPMAASADRGQDAKVPGPSRTPSGSPLPTPSSSQTRIHDVRVRTRKVSQTAHDNVDMLDGTDPWGTNWHHTSPYDLGNDRVSSDTASEHPAAQRHRRMSLTTTGSRHKTTVPSPLSQSTSAVNLQAESAPVQIPRRLSKTRKPFHDLFAGAQTNGTASKRISEPPPALNLPDRPLKRGMSTGPSLSSAAPSLMEKKEKRGSILGRLAKRFSVMRRPDRNRSSATVASIDTHTVMSGRPSIDTVPVTPLRSTPSPKKPSFHQAKSPDGSRRIQPPNLPDEPLTPVEKPFTEDDVVSIPSIEEHYQLSRLTIANPDEPTPPTPAEDSTPLPALPQEPSTPQHFRLNGVLGIPLSHTPPLMELPDTPVQHRLSTILSVEAPGTSPSPPLPDLPPVTPSIIHRAMSEPSLPPTPEGTRPPTPVQQRSPIPPEAPLPASPPLSNGSHARNALSYAMSPSSLSTLPSTEDFAVSRASMFVEPPTPHAPAIVIPSQTQAPPMPSPEQVLQSNGAAPASRDHSPSKRDSQRVKGSSGSTRQTETFKLVRSPSGNVQTVGESFVVEGEHWEVVVDGKKGKKERSKSSDSEVTPTRKESKKAERDDASDKKSRDRHRKSVSGKSGSEQAGRSSTYSEADTIRQSTAERRRSSTKDRNRDSKGDLTRVTQTPVTPPTHSKSMSGSASRRERRTSSTATRPSSEFQSIADLNTLKAKEAWDLERLWKGRSMMYGPDGTTIVSTRPTIGSDSRPSTIMSPDLHRATSIPSVGDLQRASTMPAAHGSSHTYFVVQTPNGASPYDQTATTQASTTKSTTTRNDYTKLYRSFPDSVPFPPNPRSTESLHNPLPDPPRSSMYKAPPLPPSLAGAGDGPSTSDYWTKYAGVTTTSTNH